MFTNQESGFGILDSVRCRAADAQSFRTCRTAGLTQSLILNPRSCQTGISLIELIMFIVIVSVALAGIMLVMNQTSGHSADALVRKQALVVAESLLEEIEAHDFGAIVSAVTPTNRTTYHTVLDYNTFTTPGIFMPDNTPVSGLSGYSVSPPVEVVTITAGELGAAIPVASAVRITVHVTPPVGKVIDATGYRTAY